MTSVGVESSVGDENFSKTAPPMSPIAQSVPSTPPSDHEPCGKAYSETSEDLPEPAGGSPEKRTLSSPPSEPDSSRPWNTSPPGKRPSSISPTPSRVSSHSSAGTPDHFVTSPKICIPEPTVPLAFHDSRITPPEPFKMSPAFVSDHINPYLRLHPNPFQMAHGFLSHPFLSSANFGMLSQQLQSSSLGKLHPQDILNMQKDFPSMTVQQLQFLQSTLQGLPATAHPCSVVPPTKPIPFQDSKTQLSLLIQARKAPKESSQDRFFGSFSAKTSHQNSDVSKSKEIRRSSLEESDSDELLSVGSESPPLPYPTPCRMDTDNESDAGSSSLDCSSSVFGKTHPPSRSLNGTPKLFGCQVKVANTAVTANNRTLKFSIDNILKSDFGSESVPTVATTKKPQRAESKKVEKEKEKNAIAPKEQSKSTSEKTAAMDLTSDTNSNGSSATETPMLWPAWVYCTRYSDRPSSGRSKYTRNSSNKISPRTRRPKNKEKNPEEKRPRTAFSGDQLSRLKHEFAENRYLTERRRQDLARELGLNEAQIKIWFQNKRAKMKKARGEKNPLALQLMAQGLYNHSTVPLTKEEEEAAAAELSD